jgi:hypothetical protein
MKDEFLTFIEKHFFARPKVGFFCKLFLYFIMEFLLLS